MRRTLGHASKESTSIRFQHYLATLFLIHAEGDTLLCSSCGVAVLTQDGPQLFMETCALALLVLVSRWASLACALGLI